MSATGNHNHTSDIGTRKTMASLPNEIIHDEILHKLPAKSLVRFKCVSKSFNALISSPQFIELHLRQSLSSDANRLLILTGKFNFNRHLYSIDIDSPNSTNPIKIPLPNTLEEWLYGTISIVGSFNGLICIKLLLEMGIDEFKHVLINPSTWVYREIPHLSTPRAEGDFRVSFGFGFDDLNNDYKLVRVFENALMYEPYVGDDLNYREVMVYSLKEDSWKLVENVDYPVDSLQRNQNGVLMKNHLLHWVFCDYDKYRIFCFDVRVDNWVNDVPLMDLFTDPMADFDEENRDKVVHVADLVVLYGSLCVSAITNLSRVVWIMKEYGVKESWVKLFEISPYMVLSDFHYYGSLGFRKGSKYEVLVRKRGRSGLFWCDIESETYGRTEEINGVPDFEDACLFTGSLVPIPGGEKIIASTDEHEMLYD